GSFVKGTNSIQAFRQFIDDSRKLYGKYNLNVAEVSTVPPDSVVRYKIHVAVQEEDTVKQGAAIEPLRDYYFYGAMTVYEEEGEALALGDFRDQSFANRLCARINASGRPARVVRYVNGRQTGGSLN